MRGESCDNGWVLGGHGVAKAAAAHTSATATVANALRSSSEIRRERDAHMKSLHAIGGQIGYVDPG